VKGGPTQFTTQSKNTRKPEPSCSQEIQDAQGFSGADDLT